MWSAISRPIMSGVEPGPNGTMIRTVLAGQSCAAAGATASNIVEKARAKVLFIKLAFLSMRSSSCADPVIARRAGVEAAVCALRGRVRRAGVAARSSRSHTDRLASGHAIASTAAGKAQTLSEEALIALVIGLVVFLGAHVFVTMRAQRAGVIARLGEGPYKGLMSLVSLVGLVLIFYGFGQYRATAWVEVWSPPRWTHYVTQILMWPASICVVAAYSRGRIWRALKHPMLVGVKTWAAAHLISNGDLGSILLFGSFLAWAVYDRITLKRRTDPGALAIPVGGHRNDVIALVLGTILYLALGLVFHPLVVGVPVFGRPAY